MMAQMTDIHFIAGAPLSVSQNHTLYNFSSRSAQSDYWYNKSYTSVRNQMAIGLSSGSFVVKKSLSELAGVNYMMARLKNYHDKFYYYFVTDIQPETDSMTRVHYQLDPMQTYLFEIVNGIQPTMVLREHANRYNSDGTPKVFNTPEPVSPTGYKLGRRLAQTEPIAQVGWVIAHLSVAKSLQSDDTYGVIAGSPQSTMILFIPFDKKNPNKKILSGAEGRYFSTIQQFINDISSVSVSLASDIVRVEIKDTIPLKSEVTTVGGEMKIVFDAKEVELEGKGENSLHAVPKSSNSFRLNGHTVIKVDNKYGGLDSLMLDEPRLLNYPYTKSLIVAPTGASKEFNLGYVESDGLEIRHTTAIEPGGYSALFVDKYKTGSSSRTEPLLDGLLLPENRDIIVKSSHAAEMLKSSINTATRMMPGVIAGGVVGAGTSFAGGVAMGVREAKLESIPTATIDSTQVLDSGDMSRVDTSPVISGTGLDTITASSAATDAAEMAAGYMTAGFIDGLGTAPGVSMNSYSLSRTTESDPFRLLVYIPENLSELHGYFKMYGYGVNEVKRPNLWTRQSYNYVKLAAPHIIGNIPQSHLAEIEKILARGVTFWHTYDIGNYRLSNNEI